MTHAFIDVSPALRDLCVKAGVGAPERHHVVPSGFDLSLFPQREPSPRTGAISCASSLMTHGRRSS